MEEDARIIGFERRACREGNFASRKLKKLLPLLAFDFRNPDDMSKWRSLLEKDRLLEILQRALRCMTADPYTLFKAASATADYLTTAGHRKEAEELLDVCLGSLLHKAFLHSSEESKNAERGLLHNRFGREDAHLQEVNFCRSSFGDVSDHTVRALSCRGCILLRDGDFERSEDILCEALRNLNVRMVPNRETEAYIFFQFGKFHFYVAEARESGTDRTNRLECAISFLKNAEILPDDLQEDFVTVYYVRFFLFKAYRLIGDEGSATQYRRESTAYFRGVRYSGMCHYDEARLRRELQIA